MASVTFEQTTRRFVGAAKNAVDSLDLSVADGEFLVLVGPSGCGKTTTLRMLAGLEPVDSGRILLGDHDITNAEARDRDIAMVFQNYALYPHLTVAANMGFGLKTRGVKKAERIERVEQAAALLDLQPLLHRKPSELSGGQRQRVAMGRAIVREPQVFLMDEPLSNLDAKLRVQTRTQIKQLQARLETTTIYVTHDQTEALTMGDRIAVLDHGRLQQLGTPKELYDEPVNEFVGRFIGSPSMNVWSLPVRDGAVDFGTLTLRLPEAALTGLTEPRIHLGIRPHDLHVVAESEPGLEMRVEHVEELGGEGFLHGTADADGDSAGVIVHVDGREHPSAGTRVRIAPENTHLHFFDPSSGMRLAGC